jgi:hypothetical protein
MTRETQQKLERVFIRLKGGEIESHPLPLIYYKEGRKGLQVQLVVKNATFT